MAKMPINKSGLLTILSLGVERIFRDGWHGQLRRFAEDINHMEVSDSDSDDCVVFITDKSGKKYKLELSEIEG